MNNVDERPLSALCSSQLVVGTLGRVNRTLCCALGVGLMLCFINVGSLALGVGQSDPGVHLCKQYYLVVYVSNALQDEPIYAGTNTANICSTRTAQQRRL